MDLLADVRSKPSCHARYSFAQPSALEVPCVGGFGFHVVTQGAGFIHSADASTSLPLAKGDVAFSARSANHIISTEPVAAKRVVTLSHHDAVRVADRSAAAMLTIVSGAYDVGRQPVHSLFHTLPSWYVIKSHDAAELDQLQMSIRLLTAEVAAPAAGAATATQALLDVILTYVVRTILRASDRQPPTDRVGLSPIQDALELMQSRYVRAWSLGELAQAVGLSRARFAETFRRTLGATPFEHLRRIRIHQAVTLLLASDAKVATVAEQVGYHDSFTFSKAFKKLVGVSPREFRRNRRAGSQHAASTRQPIE